MTISPNDAAIAIAVAIEGAESLPAVQQAVRSFAASFGYDRFVLFSASSTRKTCSTASIGSKATGSATANPSMPKPMSGAVR